MIPTLPDAYQLSGGGSKVITWTVLLLFTIWLTYIGTPEFQQGFFAPDTFCHLAVSGVSHEIVYDAHVFVILSLQSLRWPGKKNRSNKKGPANDHFDFLTQRFAAFRLRHRQLASRSRFSRQHRHWTYSFRRRCTSAAPRCTRQYCRYRPHPLRRRRPHSGRSLEQFPADCKATDAAISSWPPSPFQSSGKVPSIGPLPPAPVLGPGMD